MKKMKPILCIIFCFSMLMSSCSPFFNRGFRLSEVDSYREEKMKIFIEALKKEDRDAVRALFSKKALREAGDFEDCMDELFEYIEGDIISYKKAESSGISKERREGKTRIELSYFCYIYTTDSKYYIDITDYYVDEIDPKNEGLYILYLVKEEDREKLYNQDLEIMFRWGKEGESQTVKIDRVGICVPFFDEDESSEITVKTE